MNRLSFLAGGHGVAFALAHAAVHHGAGLGDGALEADHDAVARLAGPAGVRAVRQARPRRVHLLLQEQPGCNTLLLLIPLLHARSATKQRSAEPDIAIRASTYTIRKLYISGALGT